MNKIEVLKSQLIDKIADIDRRLKKYDKDVLIDHSGDRDRLHSEARGYERVLKMIDELPDSIPPTIKQGDNAYHKKYKAKCEVKELYNNSKKAVVYWLEGAPTYYVNLVNVEDLEVSNG